MTNRVDNKGSFIGKFAAAIGVVLAGEAIFWQAGQIGGGGWGIFAGVLLLAVLAARLPVRRNPAAWIAAGLAGLYALALVDDPSLLGIVLFLGALTLATLLPATSSFGDGWQWFQRFFYHGLRSIVAPAFDLYRLVKLRRPGRSAQRRIPALIPLLLVPVMGSILFVGLFAAANPVIEGWLASLDWPMVSPTTIGHVLMWLALFGTAWSFLRPRLPRRVMGTFAARGDLGLPGFTPASLKLALIAFNIVFAVQNGLDIAYLGGLARLPENITLAEYAHRGAYPLIATALLAGVFTLATLRPGSTSARDPLSRRLLVVWLVQNLFLVGSSIERTLDYIRVYSLTELRIAALAWMVLVAVGLALIGWRMLRDKSSSWLINANLAAAIAMLTIFALVDSSALAARWNVRHAQEVGGKGAALDLCYLHARQGSALLSLVELERRPGLASDFRTRVIAVRKAVQARLGYDQRYQSWTWRGARRLATAQALVGQVPIGRTDARQCAARHSSPSRPSAGQGE